MWATHPAEAVRGLMVSDRLFAFYVREQAPAGAVFPPEEQGRVVEARKQVEQEVSLAALQAYLPWLTSGELERLQASGNPYAHPATALARILIETRLYHRLAVDWIRRKQPALSIAYFEGTDTIGHVFAAFAPPRQEGIDPADFERYQSVPRTYFREIDGLLGEYRALAEETGAALLVVSDHGFLWSEGRPRTSGLVGATAGLWHRDEGIYVLWGQGIEPSATRGEGRVGQVAATILGLLGLPRAAGTEGPALAGVAEVLPARNYGTRSPRQVAAGSAPADEAIDRLKALGYVGSGESATRPESAGSSTRTGGSFVNEASLLQEAGKTAEARAAFEQALRLDPHLPSAKYDLAAILEKEGRSREADDLLLSALADGLDPDLVQEIATQALARGDAPRALRLMDGTVARRPDDARFLHRARAPAHPGTRLPRCLRGLRRRPPGHAGAGGRARSRRLGADVPRPAGRGAPRVRTVAGPRPEPDPAARAAGPGSLSDGSRRPPACAGKTPAQSGYRRAGLPVRAPSATSSSFRAVALPGSISSACWSSAMASSSLPVWARAAPSSSRFSADPGSRRTASRNSATAASRRPADANAVPR